MYCNVQQWNEIRRRILVDGKSMRQVSRETGIHRETLRKFVEHESPPGYRWRESEANFSSTLLEKLDEILEADKAFPWNQRHTAKSIQVLLLDKHGRRVSYRTICRYVTRKNHCPVMSWGEVNALLEKLLGAQAKKALLELFPINARQLPIAKLIRLRRQLRTRQGPDLSTEASGNDQQPHTTWMLRLLLGKEPFSAVRSAVGEAPGLKALYNAVRGGAVKKRNKALVVLARLKGLSCRQIARGMRLTRGTVLRYWRTYGQDGPDELLNASSRFPLKANNEQNKAAIFSLLHSPPSAHGVNRTTWKMADLSSFGNFPNTWTEVAGTGPGGYNILVGNGGNVLTGGNGRRNLLIAGPSASTLLGGDGEDILIGGTTNYDLNLAALQDIMAVWNGAGTYQQRVGRLVDDPTYAFPLTGGATGTVHSNGGGNTLRGKRLGSTALDLYFGDPALDMNDATPDDRFVGIVDPLG